MTLFIISFILQVIFAIGRTINVAYIAKNHTVGSVASGTFVALMWILTTKFGIDAYNEGFLSISGYLLGAAVGTLVAMKQKDIVLWMKTTWLLWIYSESRYKYRVVTMHDRHLIVIDDCEYWYNYPFYTKEVAIRLAQESHKKYLRSIQ